jgi:hypothetical protein
MFGAQFKLISSIFILTALYSNCSPDVGFRDLPSVPTANDVVLRDFRTQENLTAHAIFKNQHEAELYMSVAEPPTPERILATWARSTNGDYFPDPSTATGGNVQQWYYDDVRDSFVMPINSPSLEQIYSPVELDRYIFEATLTSNNSDDDWIGLVAAAKEVNGRMISLLVGVQPGGGQMRYLPNNQHMNFSMVLIDDNTQFPSNHHTYATLIDGNNSIEGNTSPNNQNSVHGWNGRQVRIQVVRDGNIIRAQISDWNGSEFMPNSILQVDLNQLTGDAAQLAGPARYGFASLSQADSTYLNYSLRSNLITDLTRIFAAQENLFWRYSEDQWQLQEESASAYMSPSRHVFNPLTQDYFDITNSHFHLYAQKGLLSQNITLRLPAQTTIDIDYDDILSAFTNPGSLSIERIFMDENLISEQVAGKIRVVTSDVAGSFYVLIKSQNSGSAANEETILFQKIHVDIE